jgi:hypothetical protein
MRAEQVGYEIARARQLTDYRNVGSVGSLEANPGQHGGR